MCPGVSQAKFPFGFLIRIPQLLVLMPKSSHFRAETLRNCEAGLSIQARNHFWLNTINFHSVTVESESVSSGIMECKGQRQLTCWDKRVAQMYIEKNMSF